jgi:hypothetical protein
MPADPMRNKKVAVFLSVFFLAATDFSVCLAENAVSDSKVSVSVPSNPVNILARKIDNTSQLLKEKQQELRDKKGIYADIFLIIFAGCALAVIWMIFSDVHQRRMKREERRIKRRIKRISKKRKKN